MTDFYINTFEANEKLFLSFRDDKINFFLSIVTHIEVNCIATV